MAVGNRLYLLESCGSEYYYVCEDWCASGLHCLTSKSDSGGVDGEDNKFWRWKPLSPSSPWCWSDDSESLLMLPFYARNITAHAVHAPPGAAPQDHEIFVSASSTWNSSLGATFSFGRKHDWTHRGNWELPVVGHAHYDGELETWVGLHAVGHGCNRRSDGILCAGHVTSGPLEWKVGMEKLFRLDEDTAAGWSHVDAKLVPMLSPAVESCTEYCLMERLRPARDKEEGSYGDDTCLLRLTHFYVERGKDGQPVATRRQRDRS